jgi:putative pyoverdin transport system ATP-binding/permease protein
MEFLRLLRSESDRGTLNLLLVAVFSGILSTLLIALIIQSARSLSPGHLQLLDFAKFILCLAASVYARRYVLNETSALTERIVMKMRLRILEKIRNSSLLQYEQVGRARMYSALNESAVTLAASASHVVAGFSSAVMLIFATFYVASLSLFAFMITLASISVGVVLYFKTREDLEQSLKKSTEQETGFLGLVQQLMDGFKEVKINRLRSDDLYNNSMVTTAEETRRLRLETDRQFAWWSVFGQNFPYIILALLVFVLPAYNAESASNVAPIAAAIIFIMGPLGEVIGAVPLLFRSNVAIATIADLEAALAAAVEASRPDALLEQRFRSFREISLRQVSFTYEQKRQNREFQLGPLDLTVKSNELLFVVGGNGSGKSTLLKVLTGLLPSPGSIFLDGERIRSEDIASYRSLFSIIFTDFHLFDKLYGFKEIDRQRVDQLLLEMRLQEVTGVTEDGRFKNINLSTGQRKRLALIVALLEGRPVLIFDEVAADQDPDFRRYFYEVLLRRLRDEGKTIVAATHDEHYFHVADRVLKMEDGKFVEEIK